MTKKKGLEVTSDEIQAVYSHYRSYHPRTSRRVGDKRRKLIERAVEGYGVADVCAAIDGYHVSPHHLGKNDRNTPYLSLELILRSDDHIDAGFRYLDRHQQPQASGLLRASKEWADDEQAEIRVRDVSAARPISIDPEVERIGVEGNPQRLLPGLIGFLGRDTGGDEAGRHERPGRSVLPERAAAAQDLQDLGEGEIVETPTPAPIRDEDIPF